VVPCRQGTPVTRVTSWLFGFESATLTEPVSRAQLEA